MKEVCFSYLPFHQRIESNLKKKNRRWAAVCVFLLIGVLPFIILSWISNRSFLVVYIIGSRDIHCSKGCNHHHHHQRTVGGSAFRHHQELIFLFDLFYNSMFGHCRGALALPCGGNASQIAKVIHSSSSLCPVRVVLSAQPACHLHTTSKTKSIHSSTNGLICKSAAAAAAEIEDTPLVYDGVIFDMASIYTRVNYLHTVHPSLSLSINLCKKERYFLFFHFMSSYLS